MTDNNDEIDRMINEAAKKRQTNAPKNTSNNNPDGRKYADYTPCPICGTEVLQLPGHLPCDDE